MVWDTILPIIMSYKYDGKEIFIQWSTDCTMSYDRPGIQFMIT